MGEVEMAPSTALGKRGHPDDGNYHAKAA